MVTGDVLKTFINRALVVQTYHLPLVSVSKSTVRNAHSAFFVSFAEKA